MTNVAINPNHDAERELLISFLDKQREIMLWKLDGLSEEQLRGKHHPSGMSLLGLLKHLVRVEQTWFDSRLAGEELVEPSYDEAAWNPTDEQTPEILIADYRSACQRSNEIARSMTLDQLTVEPSRIFGNVSLEWILLHMIQEVARHLGHADFIRESIDGATGVGPSHTS